MRRVSTSVSVSVETATVTSTYDGRSITVRAIRTGGRTTINGREYATSNIDIAMALYRRDVETGTVVQGSREAK